MNSTNVKRRLITIQVNECMQPFWFQMSSMTTTLLNMIHGRVRSGEYKNSAAFLNRPKLKTGHLTLVQLKHGKPITLYLM